MQKSGYMQDLRNTKITAYQQGFLKVVAFAAIFASSIILSGCVGAFAAGAVTGGTVANDRRSLETINTDQEIRFKADMKITADKSLNSECHIVVATFNSIVLLVGQAPTKTLKAKATKYVETVPNVRRIYNEITLSGPTSPLTQSSDAWITTKVRSAMLATKDLNSGQIKVVTENGSVYLMGIVTHEQADIAVEVARKITGVQRVVKIFEYTIG
jgi:osmotically-inducible protein OsmY